MKMARSKGAKKKSARKTKKMAREKTSEKTQDKISKKDFEEALEKSIEKKLKKSKIDVDKVLIENFVNLQKVLTDLTSKFDHLSINIAKLLHLFELSAKSFSGGPGKSGLDEDFLKKLDALLDQNKVISKGIMLMEDRIRNRSASPASVRTDNQFRPALASGSMMKPRPLPRY